MRIIFMGTPDFAVPALEALAKAGHEIRAVYCQPPKPQGRGHAIRKTPVHQAAEKLGLPVRTPKTLKGEEEASFMRKEAPDFIVVAAYGLLLPQKVLDIPRVCCVNLHASLLPRWRGAAPIQRAILAGDTETGITLMKMEAGLDTGPMAKVERVAITKQTTAESLHDALSQAGAKLIVPALEDLAAGRLAFTPQPEEGVTYAAKLTKADSALDWRKSAEELDRQIRALTPWPGTVFVWNEEPVKVLAAEAVEGRAPAGTLLDSHFTVACGQGALRLKRVQRPGKSACEGDSFLRGLHITYPQTLPLPETTPGKEESAACGGN